jgi:hypothetical protein
MVSPITREPAPNRNHGHAFDLLAAPLESVVALRSPPRRPSPPNYTWNNDLDYQPDGNGIADETHTIPHAAPATASTTTGDTTAIDAYFADEQLLDELTAV